MLRPRTVVSVLAFSLVAVAAEAADGADQRNGRRFDPGAEMTARAPGAPEELDKVIGYIGQWDVEITSYSAQAEEDPMTATGQAEITFMNRGHGLTETFFSADVAGHELSSVYFLGFNPGSARWYLGAADSWTESTWVADGGFDGQRLVFGDARRRNGGVTLSEVRCTFAQLTPDSLNVTTEESSDGGETWKAIEKRDYKRRTASDEFMKAESTFGSSAPDRPKRAADFDFLIGEWNESHQMTFPNGQQAQWPSNGTAVFALNGSAIMEYTWFDVDPSLPDAATTILRLYNRAMRRWECLYVTNRGHSILDFGGVREGDEIVLTLFETDAAQARIPVFVFHDIASDSYSWYSEQSLDRGKSWAKNWIIDFERKKPALAATEPSG